MANRKESTMAALLEEKQKRGRPRRAVGRKNVYVALAPHDRQRMDELASQMPEGIARADIPDMAITLLAARLEVLRRAVADRNREIPEGVTDLDSLYLLWDLTPPSEKQELKWTSIRVSPQPAIELGRAHGVLKALFGVSRSQVFTLSLSLFGQYFSKELASKRRISLEEVGAGIAQTYL